jgi:hypothetical protein
VRTPRACLALCSSPDADQNILEFRFRYVECQEAFASAASEALRCERERPQTCVRRRTSVTADHVAAAARAARLTRAWRPHTNAPPESSTGSGFVLSQPLRASRSLFDRAVCFVGLRDVFGACRGSLLINQSPIAASCHCKLLLLLLLQAPPLRGSDKGQVAQSRQVSPPHSDGAASLPSLRRAADTPEVRHRVGALHSASNLASSALVPTIVCVHP